MNSMKRAVVVFLMFSLAALSGCGSDDDDNNSTQLGGGPGGLSPVGGNGDNNNNGTDDDKIGGVPRETLLKDLNDQQAVSVCREVMQPYQEQLTPTTSAGQGSCLWRSLSYAAQNFKELNRTPLSLCEEAYAECTSLTLADYELDVDGCLPSSERSSCSATVNDLGLCLLAGNAMKNIDFSMTASSTCASILASEEALDAYLEKLPNRGSFCEPLKQKCPAFFE